MFFVSVRGIATCRAKATATAPADPDADTIIQADLICSLTHQVTRTLGELFGRRDSGAAFTVAFV